MDKNTPPPMLPDDSRPWFIRASDRVELVSRRDQALESVPEGDDEMVPLKEVTLRHGWESAVFVCRPMTTPEHLNLGGISLRAMTDNALYERISAVCFEVASVVVTEVRIPGEKPWDNALWKAQIEHVDPELVAGIGFWAIMESARDPLGSKPAPPSPPPSTTEKTPTDLD